MTVEQTQITHALCSTENLPSNRLLYPCQSTHTRTHTPRKEERGGRKSQDLVCAMTRSVPRGEGDKGSVRLLTAPHYGYARPLVGSGAAPSLFVIARKRADVLGHLGGKRSAYLLKQAMSDGSDAMSGSDRRGTMQRHHAVRFPLWKTESKDIMGCLHSQVQAGVIVLSV